jgi:hypothetical protein
MTKKNNSFLIQVVEHKIKAEEEKRLLTEISHLFYDIACQFHDQENKSPIPSNDNTRSNMKRLLHE